MALGTGLPVSPVSVRLRWATAVLALASLLGSTSCATLMAPGPDRVPVNTNPPGAFVYLNGVVVGQTPTIVTLDRDRPAQIQIYLPGFQPLVMERSKRFNGWFVGSILLFYAIFPLIIDFATGNYQHYDDEPIAIGLTPMAGPPPAYYQQPPQPSAPQ